MQILGSKSVKHDAVSAELPMCADSFPNNLEKGMLFTLSWWVSCFLCGFIPKQFGEIHALYIKLEGLTCFLQTEGVKRDNF